MIIIAGALRDAAARNATSRVAETLVIALKPIDVARAIAPYLTLTPVLRSLSRATLPTGCGVREGKRSAENC
jgi:hypothetical protein